MSTVVGGKARATDLVDMSHWERQVASPVLFSAALEAALGSIAPIVSVVLEVGPNPVLMRMAQSWIKPQQPLVWLASLDRQTNVQDAAALARADRSLEQHRQQLGGDECSAGRVFPNRRSFPWQPSPHPLLQHTLDLGDRGVEHTAVFHATLLGLFNDYTIRGRKLFPGAGFVEMALAAAAAKFKYRGRPIAGVELQGISFLEPLDLEVGTALVCEVGGTGGMQFRPSNESRVVCEVDQTLAVDAVAVKGQVLSAVKARCVREVVDITERYKVLREDGFRGPQFQTLVRVWQGKDEFVARLQLPRQEENGRYHAHPAVLDGAFQLLGLVDETRQTCVPASIRRLQFCLQSPDCLISSSPDCGYMWASGRVTERNDSFHVLDLSIYDPSGVVFMSVEGVRFIPLKAQPPTSGLYEIHWVDTSMTVVAGQSAFSESPKLSLLALPGCNNLSVMNVEKLGASGLPFIVTDTGADTPMTTEQWAATSTLVVPVLRIADAAVMLTQLANLLQVFSELMQKKSRKYIYQHTVALHLHASRSMLLW